METSNNKIHIDELDEIQRARAHEIRSAFQAAKTLRVKSEEMNRLTGDNLRQLCRDNMCNGVMFDDGYMLIWSIGESRSIAADRVKRALVENGISVDLALKIVDEATKVSTRDTAYGKEARKRDEA